MSKLKELVKWSKLINKLLKELIIIVMYVAIIIKIIEALF